MASEWFSKLQLSSDFHEYHYKYKDADALLSKLDIWTQKDSFNWMKWRITLLKSSFWRIILYHHLSLKKNKCTQAHIDAAPQISE